MVFWLLVEGGATELAGVLTDALGPESSSSSASPPADSRAAGRGATC